MSHRWGNNRQGVDYLSPKDCELLLCGIFTVLCPTAAYVIVLSCLYIATVVIGGDTSLRDVVSMLDIPKDMKLHLRHIGAFSLGLSFLIGVAVAFKAGQVGLVRHSYVFRSVTVVFCVYVLIDWASGDIRLGPLFPRLSELSFGTLFFCILFFCLQPIFVG